MADLTGKKIANTYKDLLQVNSSASNDGLDGTLRRVQDGSGKNSAISLSQSEAKVHGDLTVTCLLYTSPSPRDKRQSRMPSSA